MRGLQEFLQLYGLWALYFAAAFEGDITLLLTGVLIQNGIWSAPHALAVGALGAWSGDIFYFWLGHGTGRRFLNTGHGQRVMPKIERAARRYGTWSLFIARYIYGARIATMFFWGVRRMPWLRFVSLDLVNCAIWACVFGGAGYLFASSIDHTVGKLRAIESWLLLGLVVFLIVRALRDYLAEVTRPDDKRAKSAKV